MTAIERQKTRVLTSRPLRCISARRHLPYVPLFRRRLWLQRASTLRQARLVSQLRT